ncbi:thioredoxin fold domain-containing protein [Aliidiomarina celeris]|uniref:thioredoxin fold domain-containing protein n=1 Tax=Aliidiomarina celeris TaxID=2249428 RepID=UPI000DE8D724|nr:thioredoxin fold domain-containing protein [Aliidiomarina celeris]
MNRLKYLISALTLGVLLSTAAQANEHEERIRSALASMGLAVERVRPAAELEGYYQVFTQQGVFYISSDATRLVAGKVFSVGAEPTDLTEQGMMQVRQELVAESQGLVISYPAENERYRVTVFTDHTCPYCRQLHEQMEQYNARGISVDYLAFPRSGMGTKSARELTNVWCSAHANRELDNAMAGSPPASSGMCNVNLAEHVALSRQMGVTGTPAIITPAGGLIGGFLPPEQLLNELQSRSR